MLLGVLGRMLCQAFFAECAFRSPARSGSSSHWGFKLAFGWGVGLLVALGTLLGILGALVGVLGCFLGTLGTFLVALGLSGAPSG